MLGLASHRGEGGREGGQLPFPGCCFLASLRRPVFTLHISRLHCRLGTWFLALPQRKLRALCSLNGKSASQS